MRVAVTCLVIFLPVLAILPMCWFSLILWYVAWFRYIYLTPFAYFSVLSCKCRLHSDLDIFHTPKQDIVFGALSYASKRLTHFFVIDARPSHGPRLTPSTCNQTKNSAFQVLDTICSDSFCVCYCCHPVLPKYLLPFAPSVGHTTYTIHPHSTLLCSQYLYAPAVPAPWLGHPSLPTACV